DAKVGHTTEPLSLALDKHGKHTRGRQGLALQREVGGGHAQLATELAAVHHGATDAVRPSQEARHRCAITLREAVPYARAADPLTVHETGPDAGDFEGAVCGQFAQQGEVTPTSLAEAEVVTNDQHLQTKMVEQ